MFKSLMKPASPSVMTPERMAQEPDRPSAPVRRPAVRIAETDAAFELVADLPGVKAESVEVVIERGILTLRGAAIAVRPDQGEQIWREYDAGSFERTFELPAGIDAEAVTATTSNGQMRLTLPKQKAVQPRRIAVTAA